MSDTDTSEDVIDRDELTVLKDRARLLNITHSNNISVETLRKKINDKLEGKVEAPEPVKEANPLIGETAVPVKEMSIREHLHPEMRLVRLRITNLDPKKKDLPGEIFTTGNEYLGTIRKFVPYGDATEDGYHVPHIIYEMMKARKFLDIRVTRDPQNNNREVIKQQWVREFALEILPQLTEEELARLAATQAAAGLGSSSEE